MKKINFNFYIAVLSEDMANQVVRVRTVAVAVDLFVLGQYVTVLYV